MIDRMEGVLEPSVVDRMRRALASDAGRSLLQRSIGCRWYAWVEAWIGLEFQVKPKQQLALPLAGRSSDVVYEPSTIPGRASLSVGARNHVQELRGSLSEINSAFKNDMPVSALAGEVAFMMGVETAWPKLKPYRSHTRMELDLTIGEKSMRSIEDHVYTFDWDTSSNATTRVRLATLHVPRKFRALARRTLTPAPRRATLAHHGSPSPLLARPAGRARGERVPESRTEAARADGIG